MRQDGDFQPVVDYAEYLLDKGKDIEALNVLEQLTMSEDYAYYPHFLRGVALERIGAFDEAGEEYKKYLKFKELPKKSINEADRDIPFIFDRFFMPPSKYKIPGSKLQQGIRFKDESSGMQAMGLVSTPCSPDDWICKAYYYLVWTVYGEAEKPGRFGPGTIGIMRAVGWNIRTRVFNWKGIIACPGTTGVCFNYASEYPITNGDINRLAKRYYYVIETGSYSGLLFKQTSAKSEQAVIDVFYAAVPDPIAGRCLYGYQGEDSCNGTCTVSSIWHSFLAYQSGIEFRAGQLQSWYDWGIQCYKFVPMYTPHNPTYCWKKCFAEKGPICPVMAKPEHGLYCWSDARGSYFYSGPVYGNFFWRFNQ